MDQINREGSAGAPDAREALGDAGPDRSRPPYRFSIRTRVELADTDMYGVVYYGSYSRLFDRAVAAYRRHLDLPPLGVPEHFPVVRRISVDHLASARYADVLSVYVRVTNIGDTSLTVALLVARTRPEPVDVAEAEIVAVGLDEAGQPSAVPAAVRAAISRFDGIA